MTTGGDGSAMSSGGGGPDGSSGGGSDASSGDTGSAASDADVPQMHKHINRDGLFVDSAFTETALMGATLHLDTTFKGTFSGNAYASPIYVQDGVNHKGTFYIATESNNIYALDEATGNSAITTKNAGIPAQTTGCAPSNIDPLGITGTPAIDPATRLIVFSAATATSAGGVLSKHTIHAWSIDDFSEKWSLDVSTLSDSVAGAFPSATENQRSAVLIVGGIAYVIVRRALRRLLAVPRLDRGRSADRHGRDRGVAREVLRDAGERGRDVGLRRPLERWDEHLHGDGQRHGGRERDDGGLEGRLLRAPLRGGARVHARGRELLARRNRRLER